MAQRLGLLNHNVRLSIVAAIVGLSVLSGGALVSAPETRCGWMPGPGEAAVWGCIDQ